MTCNLLGAVRSWDFATSCLKQMYLQGFCRKHFVKDAWQADHINEKWWKQTKMFVAITTRRRHCSCRAAVASKTWAQNKSKIQNLTISNRTSLQPTRVPGFRAASFWYQCDLLRTREFWKRLATDIRKLSLSKFFFQQRRLGWRYSFTSKIARSPPAWSLAKF